MERSDGAYEKAGRNAVEDIRSPIAGDYGGRRTPGIDREVCPHIHRGKCAIFTPDIITDIGIVRIGFLIEAHSWRIRRHTEGMDGKISRRILRLQGHSNAPHA